MSRQSGGKSLANLESFYVRILELAHCTCPYYLMGIEQKRALANLINAFLETACKVKFQHNQYHEALFNYYILEEDIKRLDIPPYFRGDFFPAIRRINNSPLNIQKISLKEIYRFLLEEVTMIEKKTTAMNPSP